MIISSIPHPKAHQEAVTEKIAEWLKQGKIEVQPTLSKCNFPLTPAVKKDGKTELRSKNPKDIRTNTDLRKLNPRLPDIFFLLR